MRTQDDIKDRIKLMRAVEHQVKISTLFESVKETLYELISAEIYQLEKDLNPILSGMKNGGEIYL